uniref:Uncharacterized protein n=1 Tax=Oryza brachyantha TaxID=4533 RepID=J3NAJ9_ORYBR
MAHDRDSKVTARESGGGPMWRWRIRRSPRGPAGCGRERRAWHPRRGDDRSVVRRAWAWAPVGDNIDYLQRVRLQSTSNASTANQLTPESQLHRIQPLTLKGKFSKTEYKPPYSTSNTEKRE